MSHVGSRYLDGMVIAEWKSHIGNNLYGPDGISTPENHIVKRLWVEAVKLDGELGGGYYLVGIVGVEVVSMENGEDEGFYEMPTHRVYQMPFPHNLQARKQVLREMQKSPRFETVM